MSIAERMRYFREINGYSQEDLAQKLNISRQSISKWELGKSTPDINYIIKMSEFYKISLDQLLKGEINSEKKENDERNELKQKENNKENMLKRMILFYKKDFKYRHTDPELVKIKTIGWLIIIGIILIFSIVRR